MMAKLLFGFQVWKDMACFHHHHSKVAIRNQFMIHEMPRLRGEWKQLWDFLAAQAKVEAFYIRQVAMWDCKH